MTTPNSTARSDSALQGVGDPEFTSRAELEQWAVLTAKNAAAHQALGERTATMEALALIKRVTLAHLHLPFADQREPRA